MSRFQPRLSNVVVFALSCINYSFASPVAIAEPPGVSVIAAYEPVNIISIDELPPHPPFPTGGSTITDDGTTQTTTFNIPRDTVRKRRVNHVVSVSAPVNIVPIDRFPPGQLHTGGSSSTTNDGITQLTTYNIPRDTVRKRKVNDVVSVSAPVSIVPIDAFPPGQLRTDGNSSSTNDGTTVTTTFTYPGIVPLNRTRGTELLSLNNATLVQSDIDMGLNCEGSRLMCIGSTQMGVMHTLRDYMYAIPRGYRYYAGQKIACMKHNVYPSPWVTWGFYCAFMQGAIPADGVDGAEIELKMQQMIEHGCLGCGSVPFSPDNDPRISGILTVNYVRKSECEGLCYYAPPGVAADAVKVPKGMTLASP